jgi:hypothetical protein
MRKLLAIAVLLMAAPAPAHAAPTWLTPFTLDGPLPAPQSGGQPISAVFGTPAAADAAGDFFVANREWDGTHFRAVLTERLHDGTMHRQTLSSANGDVDSIVTIAAAPGGEVIAAWTENGILFVATGQAGTDLATSPSLGPATVPFQVAAGDGGDLAVAFSPALGSAVSVARRPPGGTLSSAASITGSENRNFALSLTPAGETVVAWTHLTTVPTARSTAEIDWASAARAGTFSAPTTVPGSTGSAPTSDSTTNGGTDPSLAVDGAGNTYVAYAFGTQSVSMLFPTYAGDLRLSVRPPGGSFGAGASLPDSAITSGVNSGFPTVFSDSAGDVLVRQFFGGARVFVRRAGGTFSAPASSTGGDSPSGVFTTAMGPSGAAATMYAAASAPQTMVFRAIGLDGTVGPAQQVTSGEKLSGPPGLAFDPDGDGLGAWSDFDDTGTGTDTVRAAGFDAAGPRLGGVTIPATGTIGAPLAFSATAAPDTWSNPVSIGWDFGDGTTASGGQVSHAFGTGGRFTVSVTATDAVGNKSSNTGTVSIPAASGPGGGGGGGGGGASPDRTAPTVSGLAVSPTRFAVAASTTVLSRAKKKRAHRGTTISFKLSEAADGVFTITGKKPKHGKAKRFTIKLGGLKKGKLKLSFSGRVSGKALKPGSYTVTVVATDKAGNHSKPARAKFTIVRR